MSITYKKIKNLATLFVHRFYKAIEEEPSLPIKLYEMAAYLHYDTGYKELPDYLVAYTDMVQKKIYLTTGISERENSNNRGRLHFTLAHEIAHIVLHEKIYLEKLAFCCQEDNWELLNKITNSGQFEKEADIFASHIILPRTLLKNAVTEYFGGCRLYFSGIYLYPDISLPMIEYLKEKTNASENAIIIALRDIRLIEN